MPCRDAAASVNWVATNEDLVRAVSVWEDEIGLDTEFIRTDTFYPVAGLYQIASGDSVYLLDPLAITDWSPFIEYLEDPRRVKVMHACQEDIELLHHHIGARPQALFDTQLANAYLSSDFSLSYARLVERLLGLDLGKHETRSNWLKRPLTEQQLRYAIEDVIYLVPLYRALRDGLVQHQREGWFAVDMLERATYADASPDDYYRNVKRAWQLQGRELAVLRALVAWREQTARDLDVPRNRVVWDEHLVAFARVAELTETRVHDTLPRGIARRHGPGLVEHHAIGRVAAEPQPLDRPLTAHQGAVLKQLRDVARGKAEMLGLAQELIARKRDLESCIRFFLQAGELTDFYQGWRAAHIGDEFQRILQAMNGS
jgi:ribonuclease D